MNETVTAVTGTPWLTYLQIGLSGVLIPMVMLAVRQFNRKDDRHREDTKERDTLLRRHEDDITRLQERILTKDDLSQTIDRTIKPLDIKVDNNTKVIEDMRGSVRDITDKLQIVSNALSRQEGYREAKEKSEVTGLMTVVPKNT